MKDEPSMDRLLRRTLEARTAESGAGADCLDADTLAAWADGALEPEVRRRAEAHAADCARCQALLAAMARTAPVPAAPWWRVHPMRWLVPLAAGTAAVALWVAVPQAPSDQLAAPGAPAPVAVASPAQPSKSSPAAAPPLEAERQSLRTQSVPSPDERDLKKEARRERADASAPTPPESRAADADAFRATAPLVAPAPPPPAAAARAAERLDAASAKVGSAVNEAAGRIVIASPDTAIRWRFTPGQGVVDRTGDGGVTWQTQTVPAGVALLAGAAPSPAVCWIAGRQGTVLLTVDGRSWRRLAIPDPIDLVSVRAVDDRTATVTASDGRRFETTDGGASWRSLPQEFPAAPF